MAAFEVASRWQYLSIYSLSQPGECQVVQVVPPLKSLRSFYLGQDCDLGSFFEPLMAAMTTTSTPDLTHMELRNLNAVLYLLQPGCLHVFCSLTELSIWLFERMGNPANILPYFQRLVRLSARHLYLPIYLPGAPLPLIRTLRFLTLESVSVQWMAGKVFTILKVCSITFPHQIDTICLQPVTMPACTSLTYHSNDLDPLRCFLHLPLAHITVKSEQWNVMRGNFQLVHTYRMIAPHVQSLTNLELEVRCSGRLLVFMLRLLPALETLNLGLTSPCALNETFFRAFVVTKSNADRPSKMGGLPSQPLCLKLVKLEVMYKRWLRGPERTALLQVFGEIASSRRSEEDFQLRLRLVGLGQIWLVSGLVESNHEVPDNRPLGIGISSPHGIIPLELDAEFGVCSSEVAFTETEYLVANRQLSIGCLSTLHHLVELQVGWGKDILPSEPPDLPLFHTLRVLRAANIDPSFLAGRTFHKLERCRMSLDGEGPRLSHDRVTQMPVCTRLDVDDLTLLATLKLPRICELGTSLDHPKFNMIWEMHIAVNANLSGLELLHVYGWHQQADLIQALRYLPVLKSLILANGSDLDAPFFEKFVPMHPNGTAVLMKSRAEGQISAILCPMLKSLLIEGCGPTERVELIPVLRQLVTLRAECGSPLERFTLSAVEFGRKYELIGSQGGFVVEMESLDENSKPFRLDI